MFSVLSLPTGSACSLGKAIKVGQAQFPLHIFMLTVSKHPPVFGSSFQVYFLHSFPRSRDEAETEFLESRCDIYSLPVLRVSCPHLDLCAPF